MKSVGFVLKSFAPILYNSSVKLYTDNKAVALITDSGSNNPHFDAVAKDIFCFTSAHGIGLSVDGFPVHLIRKLIITVRSLILTTGVFPTIIFVKLILNGVISP